jgi:hypothetical protein
MAEIAQDFRIAIRQLGRSPGFTATAIVTLALGIGANTAIFSALNALLLKMLPVRGPQQVYTVVLVNGGTQPPNTNGSGYGNTSFSYPVFQTLRQRSDVFADLIAHIPLSGSKVPVRIGDNHTEKAGEEVSGNYFRPTPNVIHSGSHHYVAQVPLENSTIFLTLASVGFRDCAGAKSPQRQGTLRLLP